MISVYIYAKLCYIYHTWLHLLCIEPVICEGGPDIVILEDNWTAASEDDSRSAQFEDTILITETGAEILTVAGAFINKEQWIVVNLFAVCT